MTAAERALEHLEFLRVDPVSDAFLEGLVAAYCTGQERASTVAHGLDGVDGERVLTDPSVCPEWALPHAAMWVGGVVPARPPNLTDTEWLAYARMAVIEPFGALRGSPRALLTLARAFMVPGAALRIIARYDNDPFETRLLARPADVPNPALLVSAVNADDVVIAGGRVQLSLIDSVTWTELAATPWQNLSAVTWQKLSDGTYTP